MKISLKNYTFGYLTILLLVVLTIWAVLFRGKILDEVYDNVEDGLKNQKIEIIRQSYINPNILKTNKFGLEQFRILPVSPENYNEANIFSNEMIYMHYDGEEEPYRVLRTGFYGQDGKQYSLEIRTSTVEEDDLIYDLTISLFALYFFLLLSILFINHFALKKALNPFRNIIQQLEKYQFGQANQLIKSKTNVLEIDLLQNHISDMIERNEQVFKDQKLFIENASHELQTPIAIAINKLDLILENENLNESSFIKLAETKQSLWRMVNLNKTLLMLTRIENQQYQEKEQINFTPIIKDLIEDLQPIFDTNDIKVDVKLVDDFDVIFNKDLAHVLISNLIRNAIKHNNHLKILNIVVNEHEIKISNTSDLVALDPNLIYDRFYKQGNSTDSTGLGLSLVNTIIKNQKSINIFYQYENGMHQFILKKV